MHERMLSTNAAGNAHTKRCIHTVNEYSYAAQAVRVTQISHNDAPYTCLCQCVPMCPQWSQPKRAMGIASLEALRSRRNDKNYRTRRAHVGDGSPSPACWCLQGPGWGAASHSPEWPSADFSRSVFFRDISACRVPGVQLCYPGYCSSVTVPVCFRGQRSPFVAAAAASAAAPRTDDVSGIAASDSESLYCPLDRNGDHVQTHSSGPESLAVFFVLDFRSCCTEVAGSNPGTDKSGNVAKTTRRR